MTYQVRWMRSAAMIVLALAALVIGPAHASMPAALNPPFDWFPTGSMTTARSGSLAMLLHTGKVLVVGKTSCTKGGCGGDVSAELYDPAAGSWTRLGACPPRV